MVYKKQTAEYLLNDDRVRNVTADSTFFQFEKIKEYFSGRPSNGHLKLLANSFVKNVFPVYKKQGGMKTHSNPLPEFQKFWEDVSLITGVEFGELERYMLATDNSSPSIFLAKTISSVHPMSQDYLQKVYGAIKNEKFNYASLEDLCGPSGELRE